MSVFLEDSKGRSKIAIENVYPNPASSTQIIKYSLPHDCEMSLQLCNIIGNSCIELEHSIHRAGTYELQWKAPILPSGSYFLALTANGERVTFPIQVIH
jgi:hypothetical protein